MNKIFQIVFLLFTFAACNKNDTSKPAPGNEELKFITAVDISAYPEIAETNPIFFDLDGNQKNFLNILRENGVNTLRLRLWVNPANEHSGFNEVKQFIQTLQPLGFKIWIDLHYSDTWADPGHQEPPKQWQGISFIALKDSVYNYTAQVVSKLNPDYIQIGNEINNGFLHPYGHISTNLRQFITLIDTAILAVRNSTEKTQIMLHYAGTNGAKWFFNQVADSDYDMIGLSYYPWWHGKSLSHLKAIMQQLNAAHNKSVIIAETSYPFTLGWNDWTHNTVGMEDQLILPDFPATPDGQQNFVHQIKLITREVNGGGFCYWGAELIAWKGNQATDGSPRENMALFDFDNKAVPALKEFRTDK